MTTPEQPTPSPEIPFKEKVKFFSGAVQGIENLKDPQSGGLKPEITHEQVLERGKGFFQALLGLREEGKWESVKEALESPAFSDQGRKVIWGFISFLNEQGVTEEDLREADQDQGQGETGDESEIGQLKELVARMGDTQTKQMEQIEETRLERGILLEQIRKLESENEILMEVMRKTARILGLSD